MKKSICAISRQCNRERMEKRQIGFYWFNSDDWKFNEHCNIGVRQWTMPRSSERAGERLRGDPKCALSCRNVYENQFAAGAYSPFLRTKQLQICCLHNTEIWYLHWINRDDLQIDFHSIRFDSFFFCAFNSLSSKTVSFGDCDVIDSNKIKVKTKTEDANVEIKSMLRLMQIRDFHSEIRWLITLWSHICFGRWTISNVFDT